jgi:hypothetical protein
MTTKTYNRDDAPGFAKHSSSFKNDERCIETHFIVGPDYNEVLVDTLAIFTENGYIDYDVNYSTEGAAWVGVICEDV